MSKFISFSKGLTLNKDIITKVQRRGNTVDVNYKDFSMQGEPYSIGSHEEEMTTEKYNAFLEELKKPEDEL